MSEEWGAWVEHDGKGCPCVGLWIQAQDQNVWGMIETFEGRAGACFDSHHPHGSWNWRNYPECTKILRYRIRRPRGMDVIDSILAEKETMG